jgi:hypothetical protein
MGLSTCSLNNTRNENGSPEWQAAQWAVQGSNL